MRYLIQHLAFIKHVMIPWCVYIYIVRLEKEMGFVDLPVPWFVIIAKSGPMFCHPFACRYPSSIIMCQSISRLTTQLHQVPLLAVISVIDQMISFKVAGEVLRNLAAKISKLIVYHRVSLTTSIPCDLLLPTRVPIPNDWLIHWWLKSKIFCLTGYGPDGVIKIADAIWQNVIALWVIKARSHRALRLDHGQNPSKSGLPWSRRCCSCCCRV